MEVWPETVKLTDRVSPVVITIGWLRGPVIVAVAGSAVPLTATCCVEPKRFNALSVMVMLVLKLPEVCGVKLTETWHVVPVASTVVDVQRFVPLLFAEKLAV